ncbi:Sugar transferase involved in LPS biosynthesis (colanic, teichoic acid) [Desulfatibacillum alkenivorans DSM 16219]|jgi:lipopolysaccharide/colanic/teichoic acid biosynthesis glycosyltransferase|uniref:Sugar transferase involved in LPS biosynthesis (Colanic, teichoic acid) n=1 Tax=Desulfatibacillum alkenivorans DSM 16219 TaxID=1121393 RepID=A0A1M6UEX9_9BACT|nr:sugar transferase [Desulfatibacillum alkenivorans]SHK67729.1 Sugar transferase involved in LPS biosynthesis (colanic, teichoic acid) [Desulfatibacillum alkenivorans DSM 16219]
MVSYSSVERSDFEIIAKRLMDLTVSSICLMLLAPVFLAIAIWIRLDSKGSIIYHWKILGYNKKPVVSYKFRTMVENADALKAELMAQNEMKGAAFKMSNDPRITKAGHILRKYSLDELPQLWSVFKGDLSLVGPRPPLRSEIEAFDGWHRRKLSVKPGITCLWQVSGRNDINDFDEWMSLDMKYIDEWSLWLDIKILFKTFWVVFAGTGK